MKPSYKFYRCCYRLARAAIGIFYRFRFIGKENIPEGATLVCANHSSMVDPFLIVFAFGIGCQMHIIAKDELFRIPIISPILRKLGMISVNRGVLDANSVKATFAYLKGDEKVVVFPEGTRVSEDENVSAKAGAVKISERTGAPILPIYIPRKKPLFSRVTVTIGQPYHIEKQPRKRSANDYTLLSEDLMNRINSLN